MAKTGKWTGSSFVTLLHERLEKKSAANGRGNGKIRRSDLRQAVEEVFEHAVACGAGGQRVRFPVIGALAWREVKARRAGMGKNPFTGEAMMLKARPASRKPRWSFPKSVRETFARRWQKAA